MDGEKYTMLRLMKMLGRCSVVEHLPSMLKALGYIPVQGRKEGRKEGRREGRKEGRKERREEGKE
jgi:hypothetical protein